MIIDSMSNIDTYIKGLPALAEAFLFIKNKGKILLDSSGKIEITSNMSASVEDACPKPKELQKLETHAKFIDVHYTIRGHDVIGWKSASECSDVSVAYDEKKDIAFYNETPDFNVILRENMFAVFFPEDAHSPLKGEQVVKKCVIKIKAEILKK